MAVDQQVAPAALAVDAGLHAIERLRRLPMVEYTLKEAGSMYGRVRDFNALTHWTCEQAERTVAAAVHVGQPVVRRLSGPLHTVDSFICSGLDFVEAKVPAIKLPPAEVLTSTRDYVSDRVANNAAVATARSTVESARRNVVQPAIERVAAVRDYATVTIGEMIQPQAATACDHQHHHHDADCPAAQAAKDSASTESDSDETD